MVEKAVYWLAVLVAVSMPPAVLYWVLIHSLVGFWRRLGKVASLVVVFTLFLLVVVGLMLVRDWLLAVHFGFRWQLAIAGLAIYLGVIVLELKTQSVLPRRVLVGVPELDPEGSPTPLLTEGVYSRTRNPRYLVIMIVMVAFALITNYLVVWVYAAATPLFLHLVVLLEERELRDRFGEEYVAYCDRVPRFLPRWSGGSSG